MDSLPLELLPAICPDPAANIAISLTCKRFHYVRIPFDTVIDDYNITAISTLWPQRKSTISLFTSREYTECKYTIIVRGNRSGQKLYNIDDIKWLLHVNLVDVYIYSRTRSYHRIRERRKISCKLPESTEALIIFSEPKTFIIGNIRYFSTYFTSTQDKLCGIAPNYGTATVYKLISRQN